MKPQDLFPETLLVTREGERIYTTTRRMAFYFGKNHQHVLRSTRRLLNELPDIALGLPGDASNFGRISMEKSAGDRLNFEPIATFADTHFRLSEYTDERNRKKPEYQLTEEGFALLVMGFTGKEALRWKVAFLQQFRQMEAELAARQDARVAALRMIRPNLLPVVDGFEAGLPRQATALELGRSVASVSYHRSQARHFGLLPTLRPGQV